MSQPLITLGAINLEARDPGARAAFYGAITGATPSQGCDSFYLPPAHAIGFGMFFQRATVPRPDRRSMHLNLTVPRGRRAPEVERLLCLGADFR